MKSNRKSLFAALTLILAIFASQFAVTAVGQEKKTRPEPPGPDPVPAKTENKTKPAPKKTEPKKTEPKKDDPKKDEAKKNPTPQRSGNWYIRQSPQLLKAFEPIAKSSQGTTVRVLANIKTRSKEQEGQVSLGTVIDSAGFILTKASQIRSQAKTLKVEINGKKVPAKVYGVDERSDLAMLKIEPAGLELKPIQWQNQTPEVGFLLATPDHNSKTIGFGVLSVASREERDQRGFMGVRLAPPGEKEKGSVVTDVTPKSPAAYAGLRVGDLIIQVNGKDIKDTDDLISRVSKHKPGETVKIKLKREKKELEKAIKLGDRSTLGVVGRLNPQETIAGNKLSRRRTGFDRVIQHDTVLSPEQMGGPILDLEGRAIGVNIAKNGRVATYALPLSVLQPAIDQLRSGKLDPSVVHKPRIDQINTLIKEKEKEIVDAKLKEKAEAAAKKFAAAEKAFEEAEREYKRLQNALEEAGKKKFKADAAQKESHKENRDVKKELDSAQKEIDRLKNEKKELESSFK